MAFAPETRIVSFNHTIKSFEKFCVKNDKNKEWDIFKKNIGPAYQSYFFNLLLNSQSRVNLCFV
jgi:hypothetical protein